jgi:glycolate oxidase iron-sulfur subunit
MGSLVLDVLSAIYKNTMHSFNTGFDSKNPPSAELLSACVHCGFCLATCPSYRVIGKETDSPRGRIYLMDAINQGQASLDSVTSQHFDSCLGCLACVTTCPSGVRYDQLIMAIRPQIERNQPRSLHQKIIRSLIFNLFPYPERLKLLLPLLWFYQNSGLQPLFRKIGILKLLSANLAAMESLLPAVDLKSLQVNFPTLVPAQGTKRYRVGMVLGCVQQLFFSPVNAATIRVLSANGCEVVIPPHQGCCAALPAHQGQEQQAQTLAKQMIDNFAETGVDYIIINAAGCGHTLKEYGSILQDDPQYRQKGQDFSKKVRDIQEFLVEIGLSVQLSPISEGSLTIVYQDACHLLHGQCISAQPRTLLQQIPNVILKEPIDAALCCGSAGVYNMLEPEVAEELGRQKLENLLATGAQMIASSNPGCSLQIVKAMKSKGQVIPLRHPIELLDLAISGDKI